MSGESHEAFKEPEQELLRCCFTLEGREGKRREDRHNTVGSGLPDGHWGLCIAASPRIGSTIISHY